jgi:UDPglucose--hexose-1-phosphate uridylyltransferase
VKRSSIALADGRELIYFDESDDRVRATVDERHLAGAPPTTQLRHDPLTDEWVTIAGGRQGRPFLPPTNECPLCPSRDGHLTEVPAADYDVVVFENRFPSFSQTAHEPESFGYPRTRPGAGRCEVVCFTPDHEASFGTLTESRVATVLDALTQRTAELSGLPGVEQVFCFENRGVEIGVTLHHPHGQIYAYPFVTPTTRRHLAVAERHRERTGRNVYADLLAAERAAGDRVIASDDLWTAFVPAAARWPYEIHVAPHRQVGDLTELTDDERSAGARLWLSAVRALDGLFNVPMPYVAAWHQAPVHGDRDLSYLRLQIYSVRRAPEKLKYLAGSESAMGAFINDIPPEQAAQALRAVLMARPSGDAGHPAS